MYETPYETTGPYKQVDFLFLVELTGEKFQIEFFSYNKLTFCSNNISFICPSIAIYKQAYEHEILADRFHFFFFQFRSSVR